MGRQRWETVIHPSSDKVVHFRSDAIPPIDLGRPVASRTLLLSSDALAPDLAPDIDEAYENVAIDFPLDPIGGDAVIDENSDNWGIGPLGLDARRFWDRGFRGQGIRIGIADSGIDVSTSTFARLSASHRLGSFAAFGADGGKQIQHGPDGSVIPDGAAVPTFSHWHGTFCIAIAVGESDGKDRGMAPDAEIVVTQVLQTSNRGTVASITAGLTWLVDQKCDIVSLSLGWPGLHEEWSVPIAALLSQGAVVVAASGNQFGVPGAGQSDSPGNYPMGSADASQGVLISVGAHDQQNHLGDFSSGESADWSAVRVIGPDGAARASKFATTAPQVVPTMVAPGVEIIGPSPGNQYRSESGTSMATPHVAGLLALILSSMRSRNPKATPREAATLLLKSLTPLPPGQDVIRSGRGRTDLTLLFNNLDEYLG